MLEIKELIMLIIFMFFCLTLATILLAILNRGKYLHINNVTKIMSYNGGELRVGKRGLLKLRSEEVLGVVFNHKIEFEYDGELFETAKPTISDGHIRFKKPWQKEIKSSLKMARKEMMAEIKHLKIEEKNELREKLKERRKKYIKT